MSHGSIYIDPAIDPADIGDLDIERLESLLPAYWGIIVKPWGDDGLAVGLDTPRGRPAPFSSDYSSLRVTLCDAVEYAIRSELGQTGYVPFWYEAATTPPKVKQPRRMSSLAMFGWGALAYIALGVILSWYFYPNPERPLSVLGILAFLGMFKVYARSLEESA